jgi:hypothetical protein
VGVTYQAYINNGHNWADDPSWDLPTYISYGGTDQGYRFFDANGDHLADMFVSDYQTTSTSQAGYINNGHGWTETNIFYFGNEVGVNHAAKANRSIT